VVDLVDLEFVQCGHCIPDSSQAGFDCQHGPGECLANKVIACGVVGTVFFPKISNVQSDSARNVHSYAYVQL